MCVVITQRGSLLKLKTTVHLMVTSDTQTPTELQTLETEALCNETQYNMQVSLLVMMDWYHTHKQQ